MEIHFENQYAPDEKLLRELCGRSSMARRIVFIVIFAVLASRFVLLIWALGITLISGGALLMCIGYLIWLVVDPYLRARRSIKETKAFYDGQYPEYRITLTDETIECRRQESYFSLSYQKIDKVYCWRHSVVLQAGKSSRVVLSKTGFTKGTFEEFKQFLREKRPDLKIPE